MIPAIASLEDLKAAQGGFRSMFLAVSPHALRFTFNDWVFMLCVMAKMKGSYSCQKEPV